MSSGPKSEHPTVKFLTIADRDKMLADVVILDWCSILEELFLNAIDAGAKNIKIWSVLFSTDMTSQLRSIILFHVQLRILELRS
jgi:hypothetical protein